MSPKRIIKEYFGERYDKYAAQGALHWRLYSKVIPGKPESNYKKMVDDGIALLKGHIGTVVDVGCGDGRISQLLVDIGLNVTGVDMDETGCDITRESVPEVNVYQETIEGFVNRGIEFDYMVCIDTIEHLKDPKVIVKMMKNIRKFGIIVTDHDLHITKASRSHVQQFIPEEIEELFKGYKLERIPMRLKYFFGYKISKL